MPPPTLLSLITNHTGRVILIASSGWVILTDCKPSAPPGADHASNSSTERVSPSGDKSTHQPTLGDLTAFLRAKAPAWEQIVDVRMESPAPMPNASLVGNTWLLSVFTIVPTEDLLAAATAQDRAAFPTARIRQGTGIPL